MGVTFTEVQEMLRRTIRDFAEKALQVFGGYGYVQDYRDMKLCPIGEGTSEIQRFVIAREFLRQL